MYVNAFPGVALLLFQKLWYNCEKQIGEKSEQRSLFLLGGLRLKEKRHLFQEAFKHTLPVMTGYLFLGFAFGVFLQSKGYGLPWALLMSVFIYAGSMQFVTVDLLAGAASLVSAAIMTFMVNARHLFYGIAMLNEFREMGRKKPYLIFSLTDETFSLFCGLKEPPGPDRKRLLFYIAILDQMYWVLGSVAGSVFGSVWHIPSKGIDFVMTALFTVIFLERWKAEEDHTASILGIVISLVCLLVFGSSGFVIPAMLSITAVFLLLRGRLGKKEGAQ